MRQALILILAVWCAGCGEGYWKTQKQYALDHPTREWSVAYDNLDSIKSQLDRIESRLAADSARCAGSQMNVTLCGDTIWSTGCQRGGPDSIHFADPACDKKRQSFAKKGAGE